MRLHEDRQAFLYAVGLAGRRLGFRQFFLEKDYWITMMLKQLAGSEFSDKVVFKGGTSLSKGYGLIERISEDVDIAVDNPHDLGDSKRKKMLKAVEKAVTFGLTPRPDRTVKKTGSRRSTLYDFPSLMGHSADGSDADYLKLEVTAYSVLYPSQIMQMESYIGRTLREEGKTDIIEEFGLKPFGVRVLGLERTFAEKVMALVKQSHGDDRIRKLQEKVRHIYDLQQMLAKRGDVLEFLHGDSFFRFLDDVAEDDARNHTSDLSWLDCDYGGCALFGDPERTWKAVEPVYRTDFRSLLFGELPSTGSILGALNMIGARLREYDRGRVRGDGTVARFSRVPDE